MAFGDAVTTPTDGRDAAWIAPALGVFGTVGGLVPAGYEAYLLIDYRLDGARPGPDGVQRLFSTLAEPLAGDTSTPETCYFAIWEGYGFENASSAYAVHGEAVDRAEMDRLLREARSADAARRRRVAAALSVVPTFALPHRRYYLVLGSVDAAARITRPDGAVPQPPDLWWPGDRRWFVGGDTDLDWCYLAGSRQLVDSVRAAMGSRARTVEWEQTNFDAGMSAG